MFQFTKAELLLAAHAICSMQEWRAHWELEVKQHGEAFVLEFGTYGKFPYEKDRVDIVLDTMECEAINLKFAFDEEDKLYARQLIEAAFDARESKEAPESWRGV